MGDGVTLGPGTSPEAPRFADLPAQAVPTVGRGVRESICSFGELNREPPGWFPIGCEANHLVVRPVDVAGQQANVLLHATHRYAVGHQEQRPPIAHE